MPGTEALLNGRYKNAKKVILVCDNLNTHTKGAFYEAFPAAKARDLVRRIEFRYTPKHGSWLNAAENELSSLTRQCVSGRRFPTVTKVKPKLGRVVQTRNKGVSIGNFKSKTPEQN